MTKVDLVERIQVDAGFSKIESIDILESLISIIKGTLEAGENIKVAGFGNFEVKEKSGRNGRNPQTGESLAIKARKIVIYRPSVKLKNEMNGKR